MQENIVEEEIRLVKLYDLEAGQIKDVVSILNSLLALEYILQIKTQYCHWNVTGMAFGSLHELFEKQYAKISKLIDKIAEQVREYGEISPGSMAAFQSLQGGLLTEFKQLPSTPLMIQILSMDHHKLASIINNIQKEMIFIDWATQNLFGEILNFHMKAHWMLQAYLA